MTSEGCGFEPHVGCEFFGFGGEFCSFVSGVFGLVVLVVYASFLFALPELPVVVHGAAW
jgi:hypothetical protein